MHSGVKSFAAGAALATLGFLAMAHLEYGATNEAYQVRRVEVIARALGFAALQEELREDDAAEGVAQRFAEALPSAVPGLERALIIKQAKFLVHSDPALAKQQLDRDSLSDKDVYDVGRKLEAVIKNNIDERERNKALGTRNPYPEIEPRPEFLKIKQGILTAAFPIKDGTRYRGSAQIRTLTQELERPFPLIVALLGLGAIIAFLVLGARLKGHVHVLVGAVLLGGVILAQAFTYGTWREDLRRTQAEEFAQVYGELGKAGLLTLAVDEEERGRLVPYLAARADGSVAPDLVAVQTATAATAHDNAQRFDAGGVAVFVSQDYLRLGDDAQALGLTLWSIAFALLAIGVFVLGAMGQLRRAGEALYEHRNAYAYMSPAMIGMLVLVFIPVIYGISLGFQKREYNAFHFVGIENFTTILSDTNFSHPQNFYFTLAVTILWTVSNVVLHVSIGLFFALLLNDTLLKAKGVFRVLLILPWAVPNYITALVWKGMFHKQFGAFNIMLENMGFERVAWFQSFWPSFFTNLSTNTWLGFPFMMVVSLGALQSIPNDLYEAAIVDGASRWQRFKRITVPLLMPALVPAVMVGTVWTFNMFNIIYLVSGGAPNGATEILITDAFKWAFERNRYGYSAAYCTVIFAILVVFTSITNKITGATKGAYE